MLNKKYPFVKRRVTSARPQFRACTEILTSREIENRFGNSVNLQKITIGKYLEHGNWRILHKGRDRWEVIWVR